MKTPAFKKPSLLNLVALIACASLPVQAETIGSIVGKQSELMELDHQIERNERLIQIQEQLQEYAELRNGDGKQSKTDTKPSTQVEYFGQRPPEGGQAGSGLQPPQRPKEEVRKERVLSALDNARLTESFVPRDASGSGFVGVIALNDRSYQVRRGSVIEGWKAVSVELDRVVFENAEFSARKTVFQAH